MERAPKTSRSIFNGSNPYGYKINIQHPAIRPLYEKFVKECGAIPSDMQRFAFENRVFCLIERGELPNE